jgi:hypothetical protein
MAGQHTDGGGEGASDGTKTDGACVGLMLVVKMPLWMMMMMMMACRFVLNKSHTKAWMM